ncbi:MAG: hypothetical protein ICV62_10360 [Cyanobacteria bacterium Co-bin13]|nr:hypothetical protein [Cyanobacteria bacterium Co-bin13]
MAQRVRPLKPFMQLAAIALIAVTGAAAEASPPETQDLKARLLADIAFQYAELRDTQRLGSVLDQALSSTRAMSFQCFQANPLAKVAISHLLVGQDSQGQPLLAEAIATAQRQEATGCSSSATSPTESLANRAREYAEAGHLDLAVELGRGLGEPIVLADLAGKLSQAGQTERAAELLRQAITQIQSAQPITQVQSADVPRIQAQTLSYMADRLREAGQGELTRPILEQALESSRAIEPRQPSDIPYAMLRIARGFAAIGAEDDAIAVLDQAMPQIQAIPIQPLPLDPIISQVEAATLYGELGQETQSADLLSAALTLARSLSEDDSKSQGDALGRVAEGFFRSGQQEQALQIAQSIESGREREMAFQRLALAAARVDDPETAVALAQSSGSRRNAALVEITRHHLMNQQPEQAWKFVQEHQVQGMLSEVAIGFLEASQPAQALQIVQSNALEGFMPDIALNYVKAGQPDQALQLAENQRMEWLLPDIAGGFAQQGQLDSALQVADSIGDSVYRAQALIAIAQNYRTRSAAEQSSPHRVFANLIDFTRGLFGESDREKVVAVLEQALEVVRSL